MVVTRLFVLLQNYTLSNFGLLFLKFLSSCQAEKYALKEKMIQCLLFWLGNCSDPRVLIFCRFIGFTKMQLTQLLDGRSVLDKLFFKMKYEKCFQFLILSWCWSQNLLIILGGFTALKLWRPQVYMTLTRTHSA